MSNTRSDGTKAAAIEAPIAAEDDAWDRGDAAAYSERVLPDCVFTNMTGFQTGGFAGQPLCLRFPENTSTVVDAHAWARSRRRGWPTAGPHRTIPNLIRSATA